MKSLLNLLLLLALPVMFSQAQCTVAIAASQFNNIKLEVTRAATPAAKLSIMQLRTNTFCFSAAQAKDLVMMLDNDNDKLIISKDLYVRLVDKENYYDLYDLFAYASTAYRLHDFVENIEHTSIPPVVTTTSTRVLPPPTSPPPTPALNYPNARYYSGRLGCSSPIATADFDNIIRTVGLQTSDIAKYNTAKSMIMMRCLSIEQLMKIAQLLDNESYRLDILKTSINATYDKGNCSYAAQLFTIEPYRNDYVNFCTIMNNPAPPPTPVIIDSFARCRVSEADYRGMLASIAAISFSNTQLSQIKTFMNTHCFTAAQVKGFVKALDFENAKLDIAKYAYVQCIDKNNYFTINDAFSFDSSIEQLNTYINTH